MTCPGCGETTCVIETRHTSDGKAIKRRRKCMVCGYRKTTVETVKEKKENEHE